MGSEPKCPQCGKDLRRVTYNRDSMLNSEQFDAVRAGDWYCTECKGDRARSGYRYYWDRELEIPAPTPTITIPVAEYERLRKLRDFLPILLDAMEFAEAQFKDTLSDPMDALEGQDALDRYNNVVLARAAIKEQEG